MQKPKGFSKVIGSSFYCNDLGFCYNCSILSQEQAMIGSNVFRLFKGNVA